MGTRKLRRDMVNAVCDLLEDNYQVVSIDRIEDEVAAGVAALLSLSERAAVDFREDLIESLPDVKRKVEERAGVTLIPITQHCLDNYVEVADGCTSIKDVSSELEAKRCVAGGQVGGHACKTAGFAVLLPNPITREYLLHQEASARGQGEKQQQRVENLKNTIGQEGVDRLMLTTQ